MSENKYVEMVYHVSEPQERLLPKGYEIASLENTEEDSLFPCYVAAFQTGDSKLFLDQDEAEQREFFATLGYHLARFEPGSSMMLKDDQIVGFTFVVPYGETNRHISCMCVHAEHQRRGLGTSMLAHAIQAATVGEYQTITLWTETAMGAFRLYREFGFEVAGEVGPENEDLSRSTTG